MTVVFGDSRDFVKSNEIFNPLVCMAIIDGTPDKEPHINKSHKEKITI